MEELKALATDFRTSLEEYRNDHGLTLQSFPEGACGDASILLAHHLTQHGFGPFRYMCGRRDDATHTWLSDGELIIDITADQFDDFDVPVFVSSTSSWHDSLDGRDMHEAAISVWGDEWAAKFRAAYAVLTMD
ncbi:hypothetical protein GFL38_11360 [Rhizobium leguminosarum bv. viciae]|uniref:hypothetical protein n=1 Tax=Rhizobium ruizarguesonis TaxID=2081791 RepID=UPI00143FAA75|nr:hypothetical protein [Rhizobium ruizarguesonis]NKJ72850.1 hypothetical protein [Rhizobium leguminosarum bv. viciae]NKQ80531.1 hypothetical protein [Rhizobium ruizarguesonis]